MQESKAQDSNTTRTLQTHPKQEVAARKMACVNYIIKVTSKTFKDNESLKIKGKLKHITTKYSVTDMNLNPERKLVKL